MAGKHTIIVTQFSIEEAMTDAPMQFFRALQIANPRSSHSASYGHLADHLSQRERHHNASLASKWQRRPEHLIYVHACVSGADRARDSTVWESVVAMYRGLGVFLHRLDTLSLNQGNERSRNDSAWSNLICASQVSDYYIERNAIDADILFVGSNLLVVGDLRATVLRQIHEDKSRGARRERDDDGSLPCVFCVPDGEARASAPGRDHISSSFCAMDFFMVPSSIGTDWYLAINASASMGAVRYAHEAFAEAARSVTGGIVYFRGSSALLVRVGEVWTDGSEDDISMLDLDAGPVDSIQPPQPILIEFDGVVHKYINSDCNMKLFISNNEVYRTASVIMRAFQSLHDLGGSSYSQMLGCEAMDWSSQFSIPPGAPPSSWVERALYFPFEAYADLFKPPRIFDILMLDKGEADFFNVQLRRQYLGGLVDAHLIIESSLDCANGTERPLYFHRNREMLDGFYVVVGLCLWSFEMTQWLLITQSSS